LLPNLGLSKFVTFFLNTAVGFESLSLRQINQPSLIHEQRFV
jgi:hypothetical protein